jgi:hypothetical protein
MMQGKFMLETYNAVLINSLRNLKGNINSSPLLYVMFSTMIFFSIFLVGFLTLFFINADIPIDLNNVFFVVLFLFVIKGSYDFYNYFIKSEPITYTLSTQVSYFRTTFEVFLVVFWIQLGLWVLLSSLYNVSLVMTGIDLIYPLLYLKFTFGVMLASVLGSITALHYFSKKKYRLIPLGIILFFLSQFNDIFSILIILSISFAYLLISFNYCLDSYQFAPRKTWKKEKAQMWLTNTKKAVFNKEIIVMWRERILFSIIFSAITMGIGAGYMARFGAEDLLPESLQALASSLTPESYAFFGIYVLTVHGAVFVSISLFLNEEHTLWLMRHVPVEMHEIVHGKAFALIMPFLCSIPFIAYYSAFNSGESLIFMVWFLIFSYLAGVIIGFPLGAKYVGRKSDILLLYSVSLLIFIVLSLAFSFNGIFGFLGLSKYYFYLLAIVIELVILVFVSMRFAANSLKVKYSSYVK